MDVDIYGDAPLFIDPTAIRHLNSVWGRRCVSLLQNFFTRVLKAIKDQDHAEGVRLLRALAEPNETHLGLSKARARGHALGPLRAETLWRALEQSRAAQSGLLRDLEDTALLVDGIDKDIVSDITTNVIRGPLIEFTQTMAVRYGIPLHEGVSAGAVWDPSTRHWNSVHADLPMTPFGKLLLVPKTIVRLGVSYSGEEYYRHYILPHLQGVELAAGSNLVHVLKNGQRRVNKSDVAIKYGSETGTIVRITAENPEILSRYKTAKDTLPLPPLSHEELKATVGIEPPPWDALLHEVIKLPAGHATATAYHEAVEGLLTPLFYPVLEYPLHEWEIHEGRKRIDIVFPNTASSGFFQWVAAHYPAALIVVECKNYSDDVANAELDQLAGRFNPTRGRVGFLISRSFEDKALFIERCRDTARDHNGYIIALDDEDLKELVGMRKVDNQKGITDFLMKRFLELIR